MNSLEHNFVTRIHTQARLRPNALAIVAPGQLMSYSRLVRVVGIVASCLRAQGVAAGQVVGMCVGHRPLYPVTVLALAQIGAVSLPLHPAVPKDRLALAARRFGAEWVVSGRAEHALDGLRFVDLAGLDFGEAADCDTEIHPVAADAPLRVMITSGTSGDPKGMLLDHARLALRCDEGDPGMSHLSRVLPMDMNFLLGFRPLLGALNRGAVVVMPTAFTPAELLHALIAYRVTHVTLSPVQARDLARVAADAGLACPDLSCLRLAGGAVARELLAEVGARLTNAVSVVYGTTESGLATCALPEVLERKPTTVGYPLNWADVEVIDDEGLPCAAEVSGQVRIRSPHQVAGYEAAEQRYARQFRDGWFHTGDLGHFDAEGLLFIDGRIDERLNLGGMKIDPDAIEGALCRHPAVIDAGVFVADGGEGRDVLAAALVLVDARALRGVERHAGDILGPLAPARYVLVAELPRTPTGKLRRGELAAMCAPANAGATRH